MMKRTDLRILIIASVILFSALPNSRCDYVASAKTGIDKSISENKNDLSNLSNEIVEHKSEAKAIEKKRERLDNRMEKSDSFRKRQEKDRYIYNYNIRIKKKELAQVDKKLDGVCRAIDIEKDLLRGITRRLYSSYHLMNSSICRIEPVAFARNDTLSKLCEKQLGKIRTLVSEKAAFESKREGIEKYLKTERNLIEKAEKNIEYAERRNKKRLENFETISADKRKIVDKINKLKEHQKKLEDTIRSLIDRKKKILATEAGVKSGMLDPSQFYPWPIKGGLEHIRSNAKSDELIPHIDFVVPENTPVYAIARGTVIFASYFNKSYGNLVIIDHGQSYVTLYAHLSSISIKVDETVTKGMQLALSGYHELISAPGLRFEARKDGVAIDPLIWFPF